MQPLRARSFSALAHLRVQETEEGNEDTMATKVEQRTYEEAVDWLREHGFDLIEAPGTQGRVFLKKYNGFGGYPERW